MTDAQLRAHEAAQLRKVAAFIEQFVGDHGRTWGIDRELWLEVAKRKGALADALDISLGLVPREVM